MIVPMRLFLLAVAVAMLGCTNSPTPLAATAATAVSRPVVVGVAQWGGTPGVVPAVAQRITRMTVHHQGETWPKPGPGGDDVQAYLRRLQTWSRNTKQWVDIPYHYIVAPDGRIYAARDEGLAGDTNTEYRPEGHVLVMLMGNFEIVEPTREQLGATVVLLAWLAQRHGLGVQTIASHRDFSQQTACPGEHLYRHIKSGWLRNAVAARLQGSMLPLP